MKFSREPAVIFGIVAAVAAAVTDAVQQANAGGSFNAWTLALALIPLLAGIATRYLVVPVEVVRSVIGQARSASEAVTDLANRVDVATTNRPGS